MITVGKTETKYYKHSLNECSSKIEGIKTVIDLMRNETNIDMVRNLCDSIDELCNELLREIRN